MAVIVSMTTGALLLVLLADTRDKLTILYTIFIKYCISAVTINMNWKLEQTCSEQEISYVQLMCCVNEPLHE